MIDFARHPFAASQWIDENFKTSISEVDARRLMQDLTLVDISRLDRSRPSSGAWALRRTRASWRFWTAWRSFAHHRSMSSCSTG